MNKKILDYLGLAQKGAMLISGEETVISALQQKKAKMVFIASDASDKTLDKFQRKCHFYNITCVDKFTSTELSSAIGRFRKIIAITDAGFALSLEKMMR